MLRIISKIQSEKLEVNKILYIVKKVNFLLMSILTLRASVFFSIFCFLNLTLTSQVNSVDYDVYDNNNSSLKEVFGLVNLDSNSSYCIEVEGTYSVWSPGTWTNPCGIIENAPIYPSSGGFMTGNVGFDFAYNFSRPTLTGCSGFSNPVLAQPFPRISITLDSGATWFHPSVGAYDSSHIYKFEVIGRGYPIGVRQNSGVNADDYGVLKFELQKIPSLNFKSDTTVCSNQTLLLDVTTSNATYLWQDSSTNSTYSAVDSGLYWVEITLHDYCTKRDSIYIRYASEIAINLGNDTSICPNSSILLDATLPGATYSWQDNSTGATFLAQNSGIYWVDVTLNNCTKRDSIAISLIPEIPINLGNDTLLCNNTSITLDVTLSGASYLWQDSSTNSTYNVKDSGIYWVEVTLNNCIKRDSIIVSLKNSVLPYNIGNDTSICPNSTLLLDATLPRHFYKWQDGSTNSTFLVKDSGVYWVDYIGRGAGSCTVRDSIVVSLKPEIPIELGNDTIICPNSSILIDATIPGATYSWQDNSTAATFIAQDSGIYWVDVTLDNCIKRDSIQIEIKQEINNDLGPDTTICLGDSVILGSPTSMATYLWQDGSTNPNFIARSEGINWLEVRLNGCTKRDSIEVFVLTNSFKGLGNDTTLCFGSTLNLNESLPNVFYLWDDNSTNPTNTITKAGTYWLEVSLPKCKKRDSIIVSYEDEIDANLSGDTTLCFGDTLSFDLTQANATYLWSDSSTKASFDIDIQGIYWVEVSLNNCVKRDSIMVLFSPQRKLNLGNDSTLCIDETLLLDATFANSTYLWQDGSTNPTYLANDSGLYWVAVSDVCATFRDSIYISYLDCNCPVYIPNVITPNNDGVNDFFYVSTTCDLEPFRLRIFNRWGIELLSYNNVALKWDARVNGTFVEGGLYFYTIEYKSEFESSTIKKAGSFSILR